MRVAETLHADFTQIWLDTSVYIHVIITTLLLVEIFGTDGAGVWLGTNVYANVLLQSVNECLAAVTTVIWLHSEMLTHVAFQITPESKCFTTYPTLIAFGSHVDAGMSNQMWLVYEVLATGVTLEAFIVAVALHMVIHLGLDQKQFTANWTWELFSFDVLPVAGANMITEVLQFTEPFHAVVTFEEFLVDVVLHVCCKRITPCESIATHLTHVNPSLVSMGQ